MQPSFWLTAALLGSLYGGADITRIAIWIGVIFLSVFLHELGHAAAARYFGGKPHIELHGLGGTTSTDTPEHTALRDVLITLAGPAAGALSALGLYLLYRAQPSAILAGAMNLNIFWTLVNLLPIQPMDGGAVLRTVLHRYWGLRGSRFSHLVGFGLAAILAVVFFLTGMQLTALGLVFLAVSNFRAGREVAELEQIPDAEVEEFDEAQELLEKEPVKSARRLVRLRRKTKSKKVREACTILLGQFLHKEGRLRSALKLFEGLGDALPRELLANLQRLHYETGAYAKALKVGSEAFLSDPDPETAFFNALAASALKDELGVARWLRTALRRGLPESALDDPAFDWIRRDPLFKDLR